MQAVVYVRPVDLMLNWGALVNIPDPETDSRDVSLEVEATGESEPSSDIREISPVERARDELRRNVSTEH